MMSLRARPLALGCGLLLAAAAPAAAGERDSPPAQDSVKQPAPATSDTAEGDEAAEGDKRICRYVRLDVSSRRKTKVCRTTEEWRELGNPR